MGDTTQWEPYKTGLRAYHGDASLKAAMLVEIEKHRLADAIARGHYWVPYTPETPETMTESSIGGSGCAVGCSIDSLRRITGKEISRSEHEHYESELGIPTVLAYIEDWVFEHLLLARSKTWPGEFLESIPVGANLDAVAPQFLLWLLTDPEVGFKSHGKDTAFSASVELLISLYERLSQRQSISMRERQEIEDVVSLEMPTWTESWYHVSDHITLFSNWLYYAAPWYNPESKPQNDIVDTAANKLLELLAEAPVKDKQMLVSLERIGIKSDTLTERFCDDLC